MWFVSRCLDYFLIFSKACAVTLWTTFMKYWSLQKVKIKVLGNVGKVLIKFRKNIERFAIQILRSLMKFKKNFESPEVTF